jgi:hypothetical protein
MKVKFEATFEVPESFVDMTDPELRMAFYEEFLRTAHQAHLEHALELESVKGNHQNTNGNILRVLDFAKRHSLAWAKITDVPEWTLERL